MIKEDISVTTHLPTIILYKPNGKVTTRTRTPITFFIISTLDLSFVNTLKKEASRSLKGKSNKETFFLLVENNSCKNCQNFRKILNNEHVDYIVLKENTKEYDKILDKMERK